ncbi:MAG TPA: TolC family protein [Desulfobulbaceae bacterium]|nr:MAG: RND transporter [Deltaproteobacteria bacterium RIFOXYD12_FULL_53_23]HCC55572.1 TolC family protein [Desulfobulbaceae bacterium]
MKKILFFSIMSFFFTSAAWATEPLTLTEALATAAKNHPQIEEAVANLAATEARLGQSKANYWPQINLAADWNKGDSFLTALGGIKKTEVATTSVVLRQNLYDFGRTAGASAAALGAKAAAEEGVSVSRQDVAFRVKAAWYLVLAAERQVEASRKTVMAREGLARQAGEFFRHGIRSRVEVARSEASLFAGKSLLIRAKNNRDLARLELANAMGLNSLADRSLAEPEAHTDHPVPETLTSLREEALRNRNELKRLASLKDAASGSLRSARSGYLPTLSGTASYGEAAQSLLPEGQVWALGVNLSLPVFSGFATQEQVREADAAIHSVNAQQKNLQLQVAREVESAWLGISEAQARLTASSKEAEAAQESQRLSLERYQEGLGTMVEALDAQAQSLNAETAQIQAGYDQKIARARLDRALSRP